MGIFGKLFGAREPGDNYNDLFKAAGNLLGPHMILAGEPRRPLSAKDRADVETSISYYKRAVQHEPTSWPAMWLMGKGHQVLGRNEDARSAFSDAWTIHKENPDVGRELSIACMETGDFERAVTVGEELVQNHPSDAGLVANLALSLLMAARLEEASEKIDEALMRAPSDSISSALKSRIEEVKSGKRPQPRTVLELMS